MVGAETLLWGNILAVVLQQDTLAREGTWAGAWTAAGGGGQGKGKGRGMGAGRDRDAKQVVCGDQSWGCWGMRTGRHHGPEGGNHHRVCPGGGGGAGAVGAD